MNITLVDFVCNLQVCEVETLTVTEWNSSRWQKSHSFALMKVCHDLQVKRLSFSLGPPHITASDHFYSVLESYGSSRPIPNWLQLREIRIVLNTTVYPPLWYHFLRCSCVRKMSWQVIRVRHPRTVFDDILHSLALENNFHLQKLYFSTECQENMLFNQLSSLDFNLTKRGAEVANLLSRNCRAFEKCQKAIILLLGSSKLKSSRLFSSVGRDAMSIVIFMVWETRGTKVWTE